MKGNRGRFQQGGPKQLVSCRREAAVDSLIGRAQNTEMS
jgi:hypothetical protein